MDVYIYKVERKDIFNELGAGETTGWPEDILDGWIHQNVWGHVFQDSRYPDIWYTRATVIQQLTLLKLSLNAYIQYTFYSGCHAEVYGIKYPRKEPLCAFCVTASQYPVDIHVFIASYIPICKYLDLNNIGLKFKGDKHEMTASLELKPESKWKPNIPRRYAGHR